MMDLDIGVVQVGFDGDGGGGDDGGDDADGGGDGKDVGDRQGWTGCSTPPPRPK